MKRDKIRVVYTPVNVWGFEYDRVVTTVMPAGASLGDVLREFERLKSGKGQPYNRRYRVKSVTLITEELEE